LEGPILQRHRCWHRGFNQGDQKSLRRSRPKCSPTRFFDKIYIYRTETLEKDGHKFALLLLFSKKLPNVNNHPIGENLPNLVILASTYSTSKRNSFRFLEIHQINHTRISSCQYIHMVNR
jgi:hypothetical protein